MPFFRKRPVVIEAVQWTGDNWDELKAFCPAAFRVENAYGRPTDSVFITTLEGEMQARWGSWIIKGVRGEFYPCNPDIFEQTYELESPIDPVGTTGDGRPVFAV